MKLKLDWNRPVPLVSSSTGYYQINLDSIPDEPAIYIFARKWGKSYEALYIGRSTRLKRRVKGHLNNLKLMDHLKKAKTGKRVLIYGVPVTKKGQQQAKVLESLEKAFIRHFLLEGHDLVNKMGVTIRYHQIDSVGKIPRAFVPSQIYLER